MIPDFSKLGYQIMGITSLNVQEKPPANHKHATETQNTFSILPLSETPFMGQFATESI